MRKSVGNRNIHQPLSRPKSIRAGEYAGGRKIGLERVKAFTTVRHLTIH
jgi:hypothetical protein